MNSLKKRTDILSHADKGGAIVIQDVHEYIKEAERQLRMKRHTNKFRKKINNEFVNENIDEFAKVNAISNTVLTSLKTSSPNILKFYTLPKIRDEGNPGRTGVTQLKCQYLWTSNYNHWHNHSLHISKIPLIS